MEETIIEVLWQLPHLTFVSLTSGNYCLIVETIGLNDFVEDFLWDEYEYEATSVTIDEGSNIPIYYNFLTQDLSVSRFMERLGELDANEIERIYQLQN